MVHLLASTLDELIVKIKLHIWYVNGELLAILFSSKTANSFRQRGAILLQSSKKLNENLKDHNSSLQK